MCARLLKCSFTLFVLLALTPAFADEFADAIKVFRNAGESAKFFKKSYGYAVFPTIGKGAFVIGAAHGSGRVYVGGKYVGDTSMTQVTVGAQVGGQAYREIIFSRTRPPSAHSKAATSSSALRQAPWPSRRVPRLRPARVCFLMMRPPPRTGPR